MAFGLVDMPGLVSRTVHQAVSGTGIRIDAAMLWVPACILCLLGFAGLMQLLACVWRFWCVPLTISDVWRHAALTDDDIVEVDDHAFPHPRELLDDTQLLFDYTATPWREQLVQLMEFLCLPRAITDRYRLEILRRRGVRRADHFMLRYRDDIFRVRSHVLSRVGAEQLSVETPANRLVVSREVSMAFESLNVRPSLRAKINVACINACFIDTMYDQAGKKLLLGPVRRPV